MTLWRNSLRMITMMLATRRAHNIPKITSNRWLWECAAALLSACDKETQTSSTWTWNVYSHFKQCMCHVLCFDPCLVSSFPVLFWNINFPLVSGTLPFLLCQVSDCLRLPWFQSVSTCSPWLLMCSNILRLPCLVPVCRNLSMFFPLASWKMHSLVSSSL